MKNRTANYTAFYVAEPFYQSNLGANTAHDFCYYHMLCAWKENDSAFPFVDAHEKTYSVRDGSDWEKTLKPRLHERLNASKNIILFLSSTTANSRALREEITYGIQTCGLPVIVVYPDYNQKSDIVTSDKKIKQQIKNLWDKLPAFRDNMGSVPTIHIPMNKELLVKSLNDEDFNVNSIGQPVIYFYYP